jgi:hypothetical protein
MTRRCPKCSGSRKHPVFCSDPFHNLRPDLRDAMIEVLKSSPYNSIEFAPGMRYLRETILACLLSKP